MKKALGLLLVAALVGVGLRYAFPKESLFPEEKKKHVDELLAETLNEVEQDSVVEKREVEIDTVASQQTPVAEPEVIVEEPIQQGVESIGYLDVFFDKLYRLEQKKKGQVRIAFFGDSMLDADMIVMQFRHYLQRRFGGYGVGFVPITSVSALGRYSIKHSFSTNWKKQTFLKKNDTFFPFGINGEVFFIGDTIGKQKATVTFRRGSAYRELALSSPKLFYGKQKRYKNSNVGVAKFAVRTATGEQELNLDGDKELNVFRLPEGQNRFTLVLEDFGTLPLYGVSFASLDGVIVDNLAVRGNSGLTLTRLRTNLMRQFQKHFGYDLLILSYGTNVFSPTYDKSYAWYGRRMKRVVKHLKNCFDGTDVLVVSMADRAVKEGEEMQTPPALHDFIQVQKSIADSTQSAFFSLYDAMGGAGSMKEWVEAMSPLANKDYTHFNSKGAEKAATFLYDWLIEQYEGYKAQRIKEEKVEEEAKTDSVSLTHQDTVNFEENTTTQTVTQ